MSSSMSTLSEVDMVKGNQKKERKVILQVRGLRVHFFTYEGVVKALDGIDFDVYEGESLGLVGETGCGKSVTVRSLMRLIEEPGKIVDGTIIYRGKDILKMSDDEIRQLRGRKIAMVFQDPMTFLNPVLKVGDQVAEIFLLHQRDKIIDDDKEQGKGKKLTKKELEARLREEVVRIFKQVKLPDAEELYDRYPHELSGGMRQRVMIAMAIASQPDVLIADEATTALDVTIQAQILDLLRELKQELNTTLIFVTHNLGIVAEMCDRVMVLYGGQVAEIAPTYEIFKNPIHPYTQGLMKAIPLLHKPKEILDSIKGVVPNLVHPPSGCRFHPRCELAEEICKREKPLVKELEKGHYVACHVKEREYLGK